MRASGRWRCLRRAWTRRPLSLILQRRPLLPRRSPICRWRRSKQPQRWSQRTWMTIWRRARTCTWTRRARSLPPYLRRWRQLQGHKARQKNHCKKQKQHERWQSQCCPRLPRRHPRLRHCLVRCPRPASPRGAPQSRLPPRPRRRLQRRLLRCLPRHLPLSLPPHLRHRLPRRVLRRHPRRLPPRLPLCRPPHRLPCSLRQRSGLRCGSLRMGHRFARCRCGDSARFTRLWWPLQRRRGCLWWSRS